MIVRKNTLACYGTELTTANYNKGLLEYPTAYIGAFSKARSFHSNEGELFTTVKWSNLCTKKNE